MNLKKTLNSLMFQDRSTLKIEVILLIEDNTTYRALQQRGTHAEKTEESFHVKV